MDLLVLVSDDLSDLSRSFPILEGGAWKYPISSLNGGCCLADGILDGYVARNCLLAQVGQIALFGSVGRITQSDESLDLRFICWKEEHGNT